MSAELYVVWNEAQETLWDVVALKEMLEKIVSDGNFGALTDADINTTLNRAQQAIAWFTGFATQRNFLKDADFPRYVSFAITSGGGVVYLCLMTPEEVSAWVTFIFKLGSLLNPLERNIAVGDFEEVLYEFTTNLQNSYTHSVLPSYYIAKAMTLHYALVV